MNHLPRTLNHVIRQAEKQFKVVWVTGMRFAGKKTMLMDWDRNFVSLEDEDAYNLATDKPEAFFTHYRPPVIVDEIQQVPKLVRQVKNLAETVNEPGLLWIASVQRFKAIENGVKSQPDWLVSYELLPFSLYERERKAHEQNLIYLMDCRVERLPLKLLLKHGKGFGKVLGLTSVMTQAIKGICFSMNFLHIIWLTLLKRE